MKQKQKQQVLSRFFAPKAAPSEPPSPALRPSPTSQVQWPPVKTSRNLQCRAASPSPTNSSDRKRPVSPGLEAEHEKKRQGVDLCRPEICSGAISLHEDMPVSCAYDASNGLYSTELHSAYKRRRKKESSPDNHADSILLTEKENMHLVQEAPMAVTSNGFQGPSLPKTGEAVDIPDSNPARHKKFVEKLLTPLESERQISKPSKASSKAELTPLEQQVVELKAKYKDVLLMIEVGYRYRMFGEDAEVAARVLGIFAYNDHNFITASIPTFRLHVHVRRLVEAGYKVGVVRQTETAAIKAHGSNRLGPFTRGLSALYSRATLEAAVDLGGKESLTASESSGSKYLMCVVEQVDIKASAKSPLSKQGVIAKVNTEAEGSSNSAYDTLIGVLAVETSTGDIMYGQFRDTVTRSELEAHLLSYLPAEMILASPLTSSTEKLLVDYAGPTSNIRIERFCRSGLGDGAALSEVLGLYQSAQDPESNQDVSGSNDKVNEGVEAIMAMPELVVQALALTLRHLKQFGLERILLLGATFRPFARVCEMSLSSNTLQQLEILQNNTDGTIKGSLLWLMDHTHTAFGARLFQHWLTHPLRDESLISARLDAVSEISDTMGSVGGLQHEGSFPGSGKGGGMVGSLSRGRVEGTGGGPCGLLGNVLISLKKISDVERGITRIFHGNSTASEFVAAIQALLATVRQLQRICPIEDEESETRETDAGKTTSFHSPLLRRLFSAASSSVVSEHASRLLSFLNTEAAASGDKQNLFVCGNGKFPMVEKCKIAVETAEGHLDSLLPQYRKQLKMQNLQYLNVSGSTYLIEVPAMQRVPQDWVKINSTKKSNRYHPPEVLRALDVLALAKEELTVECNKAWHSFLAEFGAYYVDFRATVHALAALDCLYSLAIVSRNQGYTRPELVPQSSATLTIEGGRHPVLEATLQEGFVPNDTCLHGESERCQIITGPNMGGKSCYIRQVAMIAIMAQVGSYVPAKSVKLHAFDAIFTRMGASDNIQRGSSTFLEELSEASSVLRRATPLSLVIMDELGRGTSTHDGVAIAFATLEYLLKNVRCLTLFVTHYPKVAELVHNFPGEVGAYHVSYLAEGPSADVLARSCKQVQGSDYSTTVFSNEMQEQNMASEAAHRITFLYKLVRGVASRSFGLHVARLAQIPEACISKASIMAAKLENEVRARACSKNKEAQEQVIGSIGGCSNNAPVPGSLDSTSLEGCMLSVAEISEQLHVVLLALKCSEPALPAMKTMQETVQSRLGA